MPCCNSGIDARPEADSGSEASRTPFRLGVICTGLGTGGAEVFLVDLLRALQELGVEPIVISLIDKGSQGARLWEAGIPVHVLGVSNPVAFLGAAKAAASILDEFGADAVQGWMYHGNLVASGIGKRLSIPVFWSVHHSLDDIRNEKLALRVAIAWSRRLSVFPSAIHYCSNVSADQHKAYGFSSSFNAVIPNGFDCDRFWPRGVDSRAYARNLIDVPLRAPLVAHIGRYHPMKDHRNFLAAAAEVHKFRSDARFVAIGPGVDERNDELVRLRHDFGVDGVVTFLGERNDVKELLQGVDILTTSSAWGEAFPIVLGEAMACGVPCVATDVGDCEYLIGDAGLIVPARDHWALGNAWLELINEPQELKIHRSRRARQRIVEHFSIDAVGRQFIQMYSSTIARASSM